MWPRVALVGRVGIFLVVLVLRITVVPNAKTRLPSVAMNLISSGNVGSAPATGDKAPYRGKSGWDRQYAIPALEALLLRLPESSRAALQQLVSGRTLRLAKLGADHDRDDRLVAVRRSAHQGCLGLI